MQPEQPRELSGDGSPSAQLNQRLQSVLDMVSARPVQLGNVEQLLSLLNTLSNRLRDIFKQDTSHPQLLEHAIRALRAGLSMHPPGADRFIFVNDLAGALWERYQRTGDLENLNEATQLLEDALTHCPLDHPLRDETLNNLAICLHDTYQEKRSFSDLDRAIETQEAALVLRSEGHPSRSRSLTNLALCLRDRFKEKGSIDDLDNAVVYGRAALVLCPEGHHLRPSSLSNLAITLQYRYERRDTPEDLQESIQLLRIALTSYSPRHHERTTVQYNLCISLSHKFRRDGTMKDLNEAIDLLRPLQERRSLQHPVALLYISAFADCLNERFRHLGAPSDLDEGILHHLIALVVCSEDHSKRSTFLNNLGNSLTERFMMHGNLDDLENAIKHHQVALDLRPPGHADRPSSLNNLGLCYKKKYQCSNGFEDLTKAIEFFQAALKLRPDSQQHSSSANLADSLQLRFKARGASSDLSTAIDLFRAVLSLQPTGHPGRTQTVWSLAWCLQCRFERFEERDDLDESFRLYCELLEPKEVVSLTHFLAAESWAISAEKFSHNSAMIAYQTALTFLVRHAAIFPSSVEHYRVLKKNVSTLAVDAFSYCLRQGNIKTAVELLEQGRGVFWTQLTRLGTPLDELSALGHETADLADEFKRISTCLRILFDQTTEFQSAKTRKLIAELEAVSSGIRNVPGFSRFLLPPKFSNLQTAAQGGPVIIMNASQYGCDAVIVLHDSDPVHVKLDASKDDLSALATRFRRVVDQPKHVTVKEIGTILRELWDIAVEAVVRALRERAIAPGSRIWWCPTSDFTFLPFHAAGPYRKGQPNLVDLYVPSYTPTLGTLLRAWKQVQPSSSSSDKPSFAIVGASKPKGEEPLSAVPAELSLVAGHVGAHARVTLLVDEAATVARATSALRHSEWVHLACHGIPDPKDPLASSFALHDGRLTLARLVQSQSGAGEEGEGRGNGCAFLSACRTTVGDPRAPDETMHLAAGMLFGGFRSVVGTILPVDDAVAGRVVEAFYARVVRGGDGDGGDSGEGVGVGAGLDRDGAAVALHASLKALRGKIPFDQQIVFVHLGV